MSLFKIDNPLGWPSHLLWVYCQMVLACREAVDAERAVNKAIGDRTGCWKAGVLVEDDAGSVKKALNELARKAKSRQ